MATTVIKSFTDRTFKGIADLIKLLPSGTVFAFQFLNPLLTNNGNCSTANKSLSGILLAFLGFFCTFASFTDSYVGNDGKVYYGIVTKNGLKSYGDPNYESTDLSKYKLRLSDFAHATLALMVFTVVGLLDSDNVSCFYPSFKSSQQAVLMALPPVIGGVATMVFILFPSVRHGVGYSDQFSYDNSSSEKPNTEA